MHAKAAIVEIVERGRPVDDTKVGGDVVVPDDIRINGQSVLCEEGSLKVHEMDLAHHDGATSRTTTASNLDQS